MISFPIVRRELAVVARRTATYRNRVVFGGIAVGLVALQFTFLPHTRLTGAQLFQTIAWGGFALCLLEGLRSTADSIAIERREGTLGLLMLTDVRAHHLVFGKFAAAAIQSLTMIISILPAFALPLLLGGVTGAECARMILSLLATIFFALCVGTLTSTLATSALTAFAGAAVTVAVLIFVPTLMTVRAFGSATMYLRSLGGPLTMFLNVRAASVNGAVFWSATAFSAFACAVLFVAASFLLKNFPRLESAQTETALQRWLRPEPGRAESWGGASARSSPGVWLAERTLPGRRVLWILVLAGAGVSFLLGMFGGSQAVLFILVCELVFAFFIKLWLAAVAPISLNTSRRGGALELLLCTPMRPDDLVRGQVDALYGYFLAPALVIAVGFTIAGIVGMGIGHNDAGLRSNGAPFAFGLFWFVLFILDLHAIAYTGLWNGLTNARLDRAIAKTVFSVLVLPWLTLLIPGIGCLGVVGWPIFWIYWSSGRLKKRFRDEAVKQFSVSTEDSGWLPWARKTAA